MPSYHGPDAPTRVVALDAEGRAFPLRGRTIVLAVGGGIAAYKAAELARLLDKAGATVRVAMTRAATVFVGPLTFQALTGAPVATALLDLDQESQIGHIQLADKADLLLVAPATADLLARLAAGMADDVVTAVALATRAPILVAPSMNVNMWGNPIVQANLRRLIDVRGAHVVGPGAGFLACRWIGPGRLAEPVDIVEAAAHVLTNQDLTGRVVVVSAGPTHERVDPVRYLGNRSSGKMGYALARAAARRGAVVKLVSGPVALEPPVGVEVTPVDSAAAMAEAMAAAAPGADVVIMAAAVADVRPAQPAAAKRKKQEILAAGMLPLAANPDILAGLGAERARRGGKRPLLVGFAAETGDLIAQARAKLAAKRCDLVVANDVSHPGAGFEVDTNEVVLVSDGEAEMVALASKDAVAHRVLDRVVALLAD